MGSATLGGSMNRLVLAVLLWLPLTAHAGKAAAWCYPSGLKVAVIPRDGAPVVGVATVVDGGSGAELEGEVGAAHVLEHLWFRSSRQGFPSFDDLVHEVGGESNAFTGHDQTIYLTVAPRQAIRSLVLAEAERLADPVGTASPEVLASELQVVQNEIAERYDGRDPAMRAVLERLVPADHPYARSISGSSEQVAGLELSAIGAYAARQVVPGKVSYYVAGDVPADGVRRMFEEALPPEAFHEPRVPENSRPVACSAIPDDGEIPVVEWSNRPWEEVEAGVDEPLSVVAWAIPSGTHSERVASHAADLFTYHLGRSGLDAGCSTLHLARLGVLVCTAAVGDSTAEEVWGTARKELEALRRQLEYAHPRADSWRGISKALLMMERRAETRSAELLLPGGHLEDRAIHFHRTRGKPTGEDPSIHAVIRLYDGWLDPSRSVGLTLVPSARRSALSEAFHGGRGDIHAAAQAPGEVDEARLASLITDPGFEGLDIRRTKGREVWVLPRAGTPTVRVGAVYPGERFDDVLLRDRSWELLGGPWAQMPSEDANRAWRNEVAVDMRDDDAWWSFLARGADAGEVVRALTAAMAPPVRLMGRQDRKEDARALDEFWAHIAEDPSWQAARIRWQALSDGIPHPAYDQATWERKSQLKASEVRRFAEHAFDPRRARLVAVVPPDQVDATHEALDAHLGEAIETADAEYTRPETRAAADRSLTLVRDSEPRLQAVVELECHVGDGDSVALWVVERALAASLNQALRNDLGITYGVHPGFHYAPHGVTLSVTTRVPHAEAGTAIEALLAGLGDGAGGGWDDTRIDRIKLELARGTALRWQDPEALFAMLQEATARGLDPTDLGLAERLHAVDSAAIAERLGPCIGKEAITVIGTEDTGTAMTERGLSWQWAR